MTNERDLATGMLIDAHERYLRARRNFDYYVRLARRYGATDEEITAILGSDLGDR